MYKRQSLGVLDACKGFYYNIGIFLAVEGIIETLAGVKDTQGTVGAPAAEVARAYKACTLESDGIEDTTCLLYTSRCV